MKILYISTIADTINAFLIPHINMLRNMGYQVDVACNINNQLNPKLTNLGCKIYAIPFSRSPFYKDNWCAYKLIKSLIKREKYQVVHTHTPVASFITRLACKKIKQIKVFYTAHGLHFYKGAPLINWIVYHNIEKYLSHYTHTFITINKEDYEIAKKKFHCKNIRLVNGIGIDVKKFKVICNEEEKINLRRKYGYSENDYILIYAAELNYTKHQDLLIDAINVLKDKIPSVKLVLAGSGDSLIRYKDQVRQLHIEKHVDFLGYRHDIYSLLSISDIAISSSRREGLPVNIMEAMAAGLPVVVTNCRGNRDLIQNGKNGIVVEIDKVDEMADAVNYLYKHKEISIEYGKNNSKVIQKYSIERILEDMKEIFNSG